MSVDSIKASVPSSPNRSTLSSVSFRILNHVLVFVKTLEKLPLDLKVNVKDCQKHFENGESVRVISGTHIGGSGIITQMTDKLATISMDGTKSELKILLANLKSKKDEMEHVKLDDFVTRA